MIIKTKFMLWLGAVFASVAAAQLVVPLTDDPALWGPIVISITVFTFLAVAFSPRRWALISVPLLTLNLSAADAPVMVRCPFSSHGGSL